MADLVVIVPTRGRPHAAVELAEVFEATCAAGTKLLFAVDDNDPTLDDYDTVDAIVLPSRTMNEALNLAAQSTLPDEPFAVGFMGDDHRPRTPGWDKAYVDALREMGTGIVYGDDLLQGERLPTQVAMTADIVRALGYYAPPELTHLYLDNFWRDLGRAAGCLRYLPDVVVEHVHPLTGKVEWDEGHIRVNQRSMYDRDAAAYQGYLRERFDADVAKVMAL